MTTYIIRRLLLMLPTLIGILTVTFVVIQFVPGGPIDQMKSLIRGQGGVLGEAGGGSQLGTMGLKAQEMDPKFMEELKKIYHLDRPLWERYLRTFIWYSPKNLDQPFTERFFNRDNWDGFLLFKFGNSFYRNKSVLELIKEKYQGVRPAPQGLHRLGQPAKAKVVCDGPNHFLPLILLILSHHASGSVDQLVTFVGFHRRRQQPQRPRCVLRTGPLENRSARPGR